MLTPIVRAIVCLAVALGTGGASAGQGGGGGAALAGGVLTYVVVPGDTLTRIGARFGIDPETLMADNGLAPEAVLAIGQHLRVDHRHIVPDAWEAAVIVINVPQRMLFHRGEDGSVAALPVAVGRRETPTPAVPFTVANKRENPSWYVPVSILEAARRAGRSLPPVVPPGPGNPLGPFWLGLSVAGYGIHGTNEPASIYRSATHGCIRLHPDDITWLYPRVPLGAPGRVIYEPVLLAVEGDEVFLEVHRDVYRRAVRDPRDEVRRLAAAAGLTAALDWDAVERVVAARHGIARPVGVRARPPGEAPER